jgi:hypothetical protein
MRRIISAVFRQPSLPEIVATMVRSCGPSNSTNRTRWKGHRTAEQHGAAVCVAVGALGIGAVDDAARRIVVVVCLVARDEAFELAKHVAVQQRFLLVDDHRRRGVQGVHDQEATAKSREQQEGLELVGEVHDLLFHRRGDPQTKVRAVRVDAGGNVGQQVREGWRVHEGAPHRLVAATCTPRAGATGHYRRAVSRCLDRLVSNR